MINRYLEKKIALTPEENLMDINKPFELEYYLLESETKEIEGMSIQKVYGIEVVKREDNMDVERKVIRDFSCCRENTKKILDKLAVNTVTPVGLPFILDDMIGI